MKLPITIRAVWDGKVFIPKEPLDLAPGTEVLITITPIGDLDADSDDKQGAPEPARELHDPHDIDDASG